MQNFWIIWIWETSGWLVVDVCVLRLMVRWNNLWRTAPSVWSACHSGVEKYFSLKIISFSWQSLTTSQLHPALLPVIVVVVSGLRMTNSDQMLVCFLGTIKRWGSKSQVWLVLKYFILLYHETFLVPDPLVTNLVILLLSETILMLETMTKITIPEKVSWEVATVEPVSGVNNVGI